VALKDMEGLVAIVLTPFTEDGKIDEPGVKHLVRAANEKGLDGVVVLGSNSEYPYLRFEEKVQVMNAAADAAQNKIPVIGTASAWSTDEAIELSREAEKAGCDAVMAALPSFFKLEFDEVVEHFRTLAAKTSLPIYYYHFPDITGWSVQPAKLARIAEIENIVGAKITVINRPFLKKTIKATAPFDWKVFTGTTFLLRDCLEFGGAGVFCPLPLIGHADIKNLYEALKSGDRGRGKKLQDKILLSIPLFTAASIPPAILAKGFKAMVRMPYRPGKRPFACQGLVKEALRLRGYPVTGKVRGPYREANPDQRKLVEKTLENLGWL